MLRHVDGVRAHLGAAWAAERQRVFLWVPVLFGAGGGLYLSLPAEPIGWIAPAVAGLFALAALLLRRHTAPALGLAALALLAAGVARRRLAHRPGQRTGSRRPHWPDRRFRARCLGRCRRPARSVTSWIV